MKKSRDYEKGSSLLTLSIMAFILTFGICLLSQVKSSRIDISESDDNYISIDLAIFEEPAVEQPISYSPVKQIVQPKPVELKVVSLTPIKETTPANETAVEIEHIEDPIDEPSTKEVLTEVLEQKVSVHYQSGEVSIDTIQEVETISAVSQPDRNVVASQLVSLINRKKEYSRRAQQRGIEGIITVQITLTHQCVISSYTIVGRGNSLLESSVGTTMGKIIGTDISDQKLEAQLIISVPIEFKLL